MSVKKIFISLLFFVLTALALPLTIKAAECYPACVSPKYECQYGTMCCTGGGCPSWVCANAGGRTRVDYLGNKYCCWDGYWSDVPFWCISATQIIGTCEYCTSVSCGDGSCNGAETCSTCSSDCGSCCTSTNPTAPGLTAPANGTVDNDTTITLDYSEPSDWGEGCSNDNKYRIYVDTFTPPTTLRTTRDDSAATEWNFSGTEGQTYYWKVDAYNGSKSTSSNIRNFSFCGPTTFPDKPGMTSPANGYVSNSTTVTLDWGDVTVWGVGCPNVNKYDVYVDTFTPPTTVRATRDDTWATQWDFTEGVEGQTYYWKAVAKNGAKSTSSNIRNFSICLPDCTGSLCGQADGCGGTCASTDAGIPTAPTLNPVNGATVTVTQALPNASVSWSAPAKADKYDLELYQAATNCGAPGAYCNYSRTSLLYSFLPLYPSYYYRVRALNDTCSLQYGPWASATFSVFGEVSGTVYTDPNRQAVVVGGICTLADPKTGQKPGNNSSVEVGVNSGLVANNGTFSLTAPIGSGQLAELMIGSPAVWGCTCPVVGTRCLYSTSVPKSGLDYFVSNIKDAWWQAEGGNIHAAGSVISNVPDTADFPYLITGVSGLASYGTSLSMGSASVVNQSGLEWKAQTAYQGLETKYAYFKRILEDDPIPFKVFNGAKPNINGVYEYSGSSISTSGSWNITNGQVYVILVNGNVIIDTPITVASGGFLAIIASGNITIGNSIDNVQGVYVADGIINTGTSSNQLLAEGVFAGWGGFNLGGRDFGTLLNNTEPVIKFKFRPDLVLNAYKYLLKPRITWAEVAP